MLIKILLVLAVFAALIFTVYFIFSGNSQKSLTQNPTKETPQSSAQTEPYSKIDFKPAQPTRDPSPLFTNLYAPKSKTPAGYARLSEVLGKILIQVKSDDSSIKNGMVFSGTCAQEGKITYPLVSFIDGKSQTTWDINMKELISKKPFSIKVFGDSKILSDYAMCADFK